VKKLKKHQKVDKNFHDFFQDEKFLQQYSRTLTPKPNKNEIKM